MPLGLLGDLAQKQAEPQSPYEPTLLGALRDKQFLTQVLGALSGALQGGMRDVLPTGEQSLANLARRSLQRQGSVMADAPSAEDELLAEYDRKALDMALAGLTVFHGTPHRWAPEPGFPQGRPRLDKIGTGEGAQMYGPGFYAAEAENTGRKYHKNLTRTKRGQILLDNNPLPNDHPLAWIGALASRGNGKAEIARVINKVVDHPARKSELLKALDGIDDLQRLRYEPAGATYKLDLPDSILPKLLDWDKPLSEQSGKAETLRKLSEQWGRGELPDWVSGGRALEMLGLRDKDISGLVGYELSRRGIPGHRYLDQGSRAAGEGTRNFVIWDQKVLDAMKVLGIE